MISGGESNNGVIVDSSITGTYVCVMGLLGKVQLDGAAEIEPLNIPDATAEAPKFILYPDGTYANIMFGRRYAEDKRWHDRYTYADGEVKLFSRSSLIYIFVPKQDVLGTQYLLEKTSPAAKFRAQACRKVD